MDYDAVASMLTAALEGVGGGGKVWRYTPPEYSARGKRYTRRERLRRDRFYRPATVTIWRDARLEAADA